jgi:hypothetical protein
MADPVALGKVAADACAACTTPEECNAVVVYLRELIQGIEKRAELRRAAAVPNAVVPATRLPPNA